MTHLRVLTLGALLLAACNRDRPTPTVTQATAAATPTASAEASPATPTPSAGHHGQRPAAAHKATPEEAANKKAVAALVAAFDAHDAKALAALYDPSAVVVGPTPGGFTPEVGRDPLIVGHEALFAAQPDVKSATVRLFLVGDHAVQEWATVGTASGGKQVGFRAASVYRFGEGGLIKRDSTYFDLLTPAVQTGKRRGEARPIPTLPAEPVVVFADDTSQERAAARALRGLYAALRAGKPDEAGKLLADDTSEVSHLAVKDAEGREAVVKELSDLLAQLPNVEITSVLGDDAFGAAEIILSAPSREGGPEVKIHALHVVDLAGGKIKHSTIYASRRELEDE